MCIRDRYSTCTYNTKEDEENVRWICDEFGAEVLPLDISSEWNITGNLLAGTDLSLIHICACMFITIKRHNTRVVFRFIFIVYLCFYKGTNNC